MANVKRSLKHRLFLLLTFSEIVYSVFLVFIEGLRLLNPYWLPTVVLSTFRIYFYLPLVPLLMILIFKRNVKKHFFIVINVLFFLLLYGSQFLPKPQENNPKNLTVMTFNIRQGQGEPDKITAYIKHIQPQLIALQEISRQSGILKKLSSLGYQVRHRPYYQNANIGLVLAVKQPIRIHRVLRKTYHEKGRWSYLFAEVGISGDGKTKAKKFNVVIPHLLPFGLSGNPLVDLPAKLTKIKRQTDWQIQETQALIKLVQGFRDPTLVLGDFNSTPEQKLHHEIRNHMNDAWLDKGFGYGGTRTYGVPLRIDFIYATSHFKTKSVQRGPTGISDHRAVLASFSFNELQ